MKEGIKMAEYKTVQYMCTYCGSKVTLNAKSGRPNPGTCSKRPKKSGTGMPHRWVVNKKW